MNLTDSAPLHYTRSVPTSPNGFYRYGSASGFPDQIYDAEYYWVDALFTPSGTVAPAVSSVSPAPNASGTVLTVKPSVTFNQAVTASSVVFALKTAAGASVSGSLSYDAATSTSIFTPTSALAYGTGYTATVSGAANSNGQTISSPYSWTFTTVAAPAAPTVASVSPANNATAVSVDVKPAATFNQAVIGSSVITTLKNAAGATTPGSLAYDAASNTAVFTPSSPLAPGTTYTATVSGATNANGQSMTAPYSWNFVTANAPAACPCTVFSTAAVPAVASENDNNAVELGMKFRSDVAGIVTGVRFYKGISNTGTHTGSLWSRTGALLASVTFSAETASGWQQANFTSPVSITANTTYVVSYHAPNGFYAANGGFFTTSADRAPLHGLASGTDGLNGVYRYGGSGFPNESYNNTNYWVDVVFGTSPETLPPSVVSVTPANNSLDMPGAVQPKVVFDQAVSASSIVFTLKDSASSAVAGSVAYDAATRTAAYTPAATLAADTTYAATVSGATNSTGQAMAAPYTWTFTTAAQPGNCPCSVFASTAIPSIANSDDPHETEVGMKFRAERAGTVTGVRFYKGTANTGSHTGHLWSSTGQLLASVTFANETATGWQQALFSSAVPIAANTTYVVSYLAPDGAYSSTPGQFSSAVDNGPLHGLRSGDDGPNGVYRYGGSGFPTDSFNDTNYWVDVVFRTSAAGEAPAVAAVSPANNSTSVSEATKPTATFNQAVTNSSVAFTLKDAAGTAVPGSIAYDVATNTSTFSPEKVLAFSTLYTATVGGATNAAGVTMSAPYSWTFTTKAPPAACPCNVFSPNAVPATANTNDRKATEVGMKFRSDVAGTVTGIRFFKGSSNTGTHIGHLWSSSGNLLASVTFTAETGSGWQQAMLSTPVSITANTTYLVSYYAPAGFYSSTRDYFNTSTDSPPLHGLASGVDGANGVYRYGASGFPSDSFKNTNYWVDVVFSRS